MILLFTRPFKVGDYIETDEGGGTVERIDMMFTVLVTPDNKNIMLPNSLIVGGKVTNFSACQTRRISIPVTHSVQRRFGQGAANAGTLC